MIISHIISMIVPGSNPYEELPEGCIIWIISLVIDGRRGARRGMHGCT